MDVREFPRSAAREPVAFGERLAGSEAFKAMFKEGMALVEETAAYLDSEGRRESRLLGRASSLAYATESMRLTTRLMQLASWLLLQRAVNNREIGQADAAHQRSKVNIGGLSTGTSGTAWDGLPERLKDLLRRSLSLQQRIVLLNEALTHAPAEEAPNAVKRDLSRIAAAFARK